MHRTLLVLSAAVVLSGPGRAHAATVSVKPGNGTLQIALDQAQEGDVLVLKAGVYRGGFTRMDIRNLTIRGRGTVVLDAKSAGPKPTKSKIVLDFTRVDGLTIEGLTIRNGSDDGIHLTDCSNFAIRRCTIDNCGDSGIEDQRTAGFTVDRCNFRRCNWGLATGYNTSSSAVSITDSTFTKIGDYAIDLWADDATVRGNTVSGGAADGIRVVAGFKGATVTKNRISNIGGVGIVVDSGPHTISFNTVKNVRGDGITFASRSGGSTVERNVALNVGGDGITVASEGNTFTKNKSKGSRGIDFRSDVAQSLNTFDGNVFGTSSYPKK